MSNTLDLSRVVFTLGRIESDRDRKLTVDQWYSGSNG